MNKKYMYLISGALSLVCSLTLTIADTTLDSSSPPKSIADVIWAVDLTITLSTLFRGYPKTGLFAINAPASLVFLALADSDISWVA